MNDEITRRAREDTDEDDGDGVDNIPQKTTAARTLM